MGSPMSEVETRVLEKMTFALNQEFEYYNYVDTKINVDLIERDAKYVVTRFSAGIFHENVGPHTVNFKVSIEDEYPTNWFEHLKQEKFPKWYLNKWPVKLTKVKRRVFGSRSVMFKVLYPDFKPAVPEGTVEVRLSYHGRSLVEDITND